MKNGLIFPFKTTWRERLDLDYLDETSARKIAARGERHAMRKVDQADPSAIGKSLKQFADYASKETIGQVHAGGFLHHLIVLNPDGTRSAPAALTNSERKKRITEEWLAHMRKWQTKAKNPVIQHRLIFTMSKPFHDKLVAAGLNPDTVLQGTLRKMMRQFQERFHPGDSIGYAYGIHHDTDHLHVHVALCPRTKKGAYVGCSTSRTRTSGNRNQIEFLMNCFERENRIWEKRLSDPLKQLDAEPLASPTPKKQDPLEEKPVGFSEAEDPQGDLITEMKLNDELNGELDALEGRRRLVLMDTSFLNSITP